MNFYILLFSLLVPLRQKDKININNTKKTCKFTIQLVSGQNTIYKMFL